MKIIKTIVATLMVTGIAACGNKEAEKQARCNGEADNAHSTAMKALKMATDKGSITYTVGEAAAGQLRSHTFSECMR